MGNSTSLAPTRVLRSAVRPPNAGKGRKKGIPNKTTALLKDALLLAAAKAGGHGGMVAYLEKQAHANPTAFMALLGKVLPMQVTGEDGDGIRVIIQGPDAGLL
ncbi:hypothetical protein FXB41_28740 [Bradyrhizobium canariense]|uniref:hypothetical protein n=1 Tax=Bradyrhizobium canariense TaxID=255045 RepID=UPI001CA5D4F9|nr:hypothetical protein [Bradyrhizobium canariense]MBW5438606.1 hypothetical protein [Bradyrhizobium canariense]